MSGSGRPEGVTAGEVRIPTTCLQRPARSLEAAGSSPGRRPAVWSPGEHLVIDWGAEGGLHVFCAVLAWCRFRFVRFAADETFGDDAGGVPGGAGRGAGQGAGRPDGLPERRRGRQRGGAGAGVPAVRGAL
jgi:hypothetical protein